MMSVADLLEVDMEEKFDIISSSSTSIGEGYLSERGLFVEGLSGPRDEILSQILRGIYTIKKRPFKPALEQLYYYVDSAGKVRYKRHTDSDGSFFDLLMYKIGNCYKTQSLAEEHIEEWKSCFASEKQIDVLDKVQVSDLSASLIAI